MGIELHPSIITHPGPCLRRTFLDHYGISVTEMARHLGVSRQNVSAVLNGRAALSAMMALRFEKAFGVKADTLMRMQVAYELAQMRLREGELGLERVKKVA